MFKQADCNGDNVLDLNELADSYTGYLIETEYSELFDVFTEERVTEIDDTLDKGGGEGQEEDNKKRSAI